MFGVCLIGLSMGIMLQGSWLSPSDAWGATEYSQPANITASRIWGGPVVFHFALFLFLSVQAGNVSADRMNTYKDFVGFL